MFFWKEASETRVPQGSIHGPLFFLLYINNLCKITSDKSHSPLFIDDASIIITNFNPLVLRNNINEDFREITEWLQGNLLSLNYDKTCFFKFVSIKNQQIGTQISFGNKRITNIHSTKFLGLTIDTSLSWKHQN